MSMPPSHGSARRHDHHPGTSRQRSGTNPIGAIGVDDDQTRPRPDRVAQVGCLDRPGEDSGGRGKPQDLLAQVIGRSDDQ